MVKTGSAVAPASGLTLRSMRYYSQRETMLWVLPVLYIPSFVLFGSSSSLPQPSWAVSSALALCLTVSGTLLLREVSYTLASWLLVLGCILANLLVVAGMGMGSAIALLPLSVGLAMVFTSTLGGALVALAGSVLLLYAPADLVPASSDLRIVALLGMWGTLALIWLALRPLLTVLSWSWASTEQNTNLLEEARDQRLQLKQALAELAEANLQLTRMNHLAQGLRQAAEDARRAKEQFVANVSHELRTPLNMIIGFSEMILKTPHVYGSHVPPVLLADLAVIQRNAQHLSNLIDDVLDLSQIEMGRMALSKERVGLAEIVQAAVAAVRPLYQSKHLDLDMEVSPDLPLVLCDPTRIREVVLNLLSNAGRFTEQGGVRVRVWSEDEQVLISVEDSGPGIAASDMDKIFRPFEQLDGSIRRRHGGSGLGLSISRSLVELHGGKMWLESKVGAGTVFYFSLPIDPPVLTDGSVLRWLNSDWEFRERPHPRSLPTPTTKPRFVVVDKGDALTRLLRRYLDNAEIVCADGLDAALQDLANAPAQALLINETSIAAGLQQLNGSAQPPAGTPTIICSVPGGSEAANRLGAADYLVKPISREALLAALERVTGSGKALKRILVVDDEPEAQQLFWRMLKSAERGYLVLPAANGAQALDLARQEHPDAILLDLAMPEMDGFQFLAACSQEKELRKIPVVVISASDPLGQPIVASALAVTQSEGLSVPQLLGCIQGISQFLSAVATPLDPGRQGTPPG